MGLLRMAVKPLTRSVRWGEGLRQVLNIILFQEFSQCSRVSVGEVLLSKASCFMAPRPVCGDYQVDVDEECDVGVGGGDACCDSDCRLRLNALCRYVWMRRVKVMMSFLLFSLVIGILCVVRTVLLLVRVFSVVMASQSPQTVLETRSASILSSGSGGGRERGLMLFSLINYFQWEEFRLCSPTQTTRQWDVLHRVSPHLLPGSQDT